MASKEIYFKGKGKWIKHMTPNKWDKWAMTLYPDKESLELLRDLQADGVKNVIRKDEDGYFTNISRPTSKLIRGKVMAFVPPKVVGKDGKEDLANTRIGNGSDVTVKCICYDHPTPTGTAKAIRWEALRVDNLIPFEMDKDLDSQEAGQVEGLMDQPEHLF